VREKGSLDMKNTFLVNAKKKKHRRHYQQNISRSA
jgi:hypothetical protein